MADESVGDYRQKDRWNLRRYRILSRVYDLFIDNPVFTVIRRREFLMADIRPGQKLLFAGVGTGLDIPFIPEGVEITGIDRSPEMLTVAQKRATGRPVRLLEMDAEQLEFPDASFDTVFLNMVLSVVSDPVRTLREASRVVKPGGSIWIMGSFARKPDSPVRRTLSVVTGAIGGSDLSLFFDSLVRDLPLRIQYREHHFAADIVHCVRV